MTGKVDLHTHSTRSDGTLSPTELARLAKESGLSAIALTDHDSTEGVAEFTAECERLGIEGISGVEISTKYKRELHIVGLYAHGEEFVDTIARLKGSRAERNKKMLEKLCELGYDINESDITDPKNNAVMDSVGRLHMANALVKKGYVKDINEAFDKLLSKGKPAYISRFLLTPEESIQLIKRGGGVAIWAHPAQAADSEEEMLDVAQRLKSAGLDAMECLYSRYTAEDSAMCRRVAEKVGLLMSGGSDFHGANKPDVRLGVVQGGYVPYDILEKLKERTTQQ
jgi:hypothetical protein